VQEHRTSYARSLKHIRPAG
jgi:hypothetical protein